MTERTPVPEPGDRMPVVLAVSRDAEHRFSKQTGPRIDLIAGLGVAGDAHAGFTVQHRSRVAADPSQPNLRQVHLLQAAFLDLARSNGYEVEPGQLGENVLTDGVELLSLPRDTRLHLGPRAVVRVTGLRNPCQQINSFRPGLLGLAVSRDEAGHLIRRAGIMAVVERSGPVSPGDPIRVVLPSEPHLSLDRV